MGQRVKKEMQLPSRHITLKRRHFDVITSKWRRFDVITTLSLRHVLSGFSPSGWSGRVTIPRLKRREPVDKNKDVWHRLFMWISVLLKHRSFHRRGIRKLTMFQGQRDTHPTHLTHATPTLHHPQSQPHPISTPSPYYQRLIMAWISNCNHVFPS